MLWKKKRSGIPRYFFITLAAVCWGMVGLMIWYVQPNSIFRYSVFLVLAWLAIATTLRFWVVNLPHLILYTTGVIGLLLLNQFDQITIVNIVLYSGVLVSVLLYMRFKD